MRKKEKLELIKREITQLEPSKLLEQNSLTVPAKTRKNIFSKDSASRSPVAKGRGRLYDYSPDK